MSNWLSDDSTRGVQNMPEAEGLQGALSHLYAGKLPEPSAVGPLQSAAMCHDCKFGVPARRLCYKGGWEKCGGKLFELEGPK